MHSYKFEPTYEMMSQCSSNAGPCMRLLWFSYYLFNRHHLKIHLWNPACDVGSALGQRFPRWPNSDSASVWARTFLHCGYDTTFPQAMAQICWQTLSHARFRDGATRGNKIISIHHVVTVGPWPTRERGLDDASVHTARTCLLQIRTHVLIQSRESNICISLPMYLICN